MDPERATLEFSDDFIRATSRKELEEGAIYLVNLRVSKCEPFYDKVKIAPNIEKLLEPPKGFKVTFVPDRPTMAPARKDAKTA